MEQLEELFKKEYNNFVKLMNYRTRNIPDAEDIVMEAFGRAVKHIDSFDSERQRINTWFFTILKNCLKDYQKEKFIKCIDGDNEAEIPVRDKLPTVMLGEQVKEKIEKLQPAERRDSCYLFFLLGYTYKEIAEVTGISVRNARYYTDEFKRDIRVEYA